MAKKIAWETISENDLRVDRDDDPFLDFPLLKLDDIHIVPKSELQVTTNSVRGRKDTGDEKRTALTCSLEQGWDRHSWPIPYMIDGCETVQKEIFDRRHTRRAADEHSFIKRLPAARYTRIHNEQLGWLNELPDRAIRECAGIWANVVSPVPADAKNHHFVSAAQNVFNFIGNNTPSKNEIKELIEVLMGAKKRYNHRGTITGIINDVYESYRSDNNFVGKVSHDTDKCDVENFVSQPDNDFKPHDFSDEFTHNIIKGIEDSTSFLKRYADDVIRRAIEINNEGKVAKFLVYNYKNTQAKKIQKSRDEFIDHMIYSWNLRRDNILLPVENVINKNFIPCKKLSELDIEIWFKDQIEGEDAPFLIDLEDIEKRA